MPKKAVLFLTALALSLSIVGLAHAQRMVVINGKRLSPQAIANLERKCGPLMDGIYRVQGDYWWNVMNPMHAGRVSQLCQRGRQYQQGNGAGQVYGNGGSAHRNSNIGQGAIINPNGGGHWKDKVFITR